MSRACKLPVDGVAFCPRCGERTAQQVVDGAERCVCRNPRCGYIDWHNPVPVVAALVRVDGHYILARNRAWPKGVFSVVSGFLESGERPEDAVRREVEEELGLRTYGVSQIGNFGFPAKNQVLLAYEVEADGIVRLNHELLEWQALSQAALFNYDFGRLSVTQEIIAAWKRTRDRRT